MEEKHKAQLVQNLVERHSYLGNDNFQLEEELRELTHPVTREKPDGETLEEIERRFLDIARYRKSHDGAILIPVSMVSDPRLHEEWYEDWFATNSDNQGSYHWRRLEDFLSRQLTRKLGPEPAGVIVRSIDEATHSIMKKLADPRRSEFSYKGLVIGYVQSGKTANFTALIAKAADAGYKLIIVLTGIHNVLRRQTQLRLDRELTGVRDLEGQQGTYIPQPGGGQAWNRFTNAHNDFSTDNLGLFENYCESRALSLAVVKKNVRVLDRMIEYFSQASVDLRANLPVLIIDDEADQASVDGNANDADSDPTRTNSCIRTILGLFRKKAYVGYTATPFANVLIDMTTDHDHLQDDLYPRNFIVSLPEPDGYFGASKLFRGSLSQHYVVEVSDEWSELVRDESMTDNLSSAIDEFLIACSVRNLRGDRMSPMSMLIHLSHRINDMSVLFRSTTRYIEDISGRYRNDTLKESLKTDFHKTWTRFIDRSVKIREELDLRHFLPEFEPTWEELGNVLSAIQVLELNSQSEDRLDYTTGEEIKVIAIGGNQLSRGLTLEGLMTSYYLRRSRQYDTLLQMARWFGYRNGYEDLTRVHTTEDIWGYFSHLALVENELRSEVYRYEEEDMTPREMAVAIRDHQNLNITAPNKMGAGRFQKISFSNSLNQTIWFPLDQPDILKSNLEVGENFIQGIMRAGGFHRLEGTGIFLANEEIDATIVLDQFLLKYQFVRTEDTGGPGLDSESLLTYIVRRLDDSNPELTRWRVAVVGNTIASEEIPTIDFGGVPINPIQRSRKHTERGFNIGVLTEPSHLSIDLQPNEERSPQTPLILLYLVWEGSKARTQIPSTELQYDQRIDLYRFVETERVNVLGMAIKFPRSRYEPNNYIGQ